MTSAENYAEHLLEVESKVKDLQLLLCREFGYKLQTVLTTYSELFHRFCPYKIGDRVQLTQSFEKQHGHGWNASAHFLIEGSIATVINCDFRDGLFIFGLSFDDESWIDAQGIAQPKSNHTFSFSENFLKKAAVCLRPEGFDRSIENLEADLAVAWQDLQETQADIAGGMDVPEAHLQRLQASVKQIERKIEEAKNGTT